MIKGIAGILSLFLALHAACQAQEPKGKVIFSVEVTTAGMLTATRNGAPVSIGKTGIFYYFEETQPGAYGPLISGYQFADGKIVDAAGGGSVESQILLNKLNRLPISSFDVATEVEATISRLQKQALQQGTSYSPPAVLDGSEFRITYDFNNVKIDYKAWNPGPVIDDLAKHDANFANLKQLIDVFAMHYGRSQFGL